MSAVKLPDKHYVGLVKREESSLPLGFMTVWGADAAAAKRMSTVDGWSNRGHSTQVKLPPMILDNKPMSGFKLGGDILTTNYATNYGGHDKWRIEDPRGFELEITSGNLAQLLAYGTVEQGEILDECVWAREGANNILLSTNTQEYQTALAATKVANTKSSWKDVRIGNTVVLQNGHQGQYLGKFSVMFRNIYGDYSRRYDIHFTDKAYSLFWNENEKIVRLIRTPKLSGILSSDVVSEQDAERMANECRSNHDINIEVNANFYSDGIVAFISQHTDTGKRLDYKFTLEDLDYNSQPPAYTPSNQIILAETKDYFGQYTYISRKSTITRIDKPALEKNQVVFFQQRATRSYSSWHQYEDEYKEIDTIDILSYYKLTVTIVTPCGNTITNRI